jgi:hypothetical protein
VRFSIEEEIEMLTPEDQQLTGDGGSVAQLIASAGSAAASSRAAYGLEDVLAERRSRHLFAGPISSHPLRRANLVVRITAVGLLVALAVAIPLVVRHGAGGGTNFQASASLLPSQSALNRTVLVSPAGMSGSSSGGGGEITIINPASGVSRTVQPFGASVTVTYPWLGTGDELVAVNGLQDTAGTPQVGTAVSFDPEVPSSARDLGTASYVVSAMSPVDVWLVVDPSVSGSVAQTLNGCSVEEVSLSARVVVQPHSYPCGWTIDGPAPAGLLVTKAGLRPTGVEDAAGVLSVWDPLTNRIEASYGKSSTNLEVDGDSGTFVLWNECASSPCTDEVTDLTSGTTRTLPKLPAGWLSNSSYALSGHGPFAAVLAITTSTRASLNSGGAISPPCCYFGVHAVSSALFVYNLETDALVESRSLSAASGAILRWSDDGGYVFLTLDLSDIEAVPAWSVSGAIRMIHVPDGDSSFGAQNAAESFLPVAANR